MTLLFNILLTINETFEKHSFSLSNFFFIINQKLMKLDIYIPIPYIVC